MPCFFRLSRLPDVLLLFYPRKMWKRVRKLGDWYGLGASCAIRCDHCGHTGRITSEALRIRFGPASAVKDVGAKLRCSECGKRGAKIAPIPT